MRGDKAPLSEAKPGLPVSAGRRFFLARQGLFLRCLFVVRAEGATDFWAMPKRGGQG